jgi:Uma2 family endonuclease
MLARSAARRESAVTPDPPESAEGVQRPATYAEYLELEQESETKHEFINGHIVAMAGGTLQHARLAGKVIALLVAQLKGRCEVLTSDARVYVQALNEGFYADASVVCGPEEVDPADPDALVNPIVLVEVLSPRTEKKDRGSKFESYKHIPSLKEYVLVSQDEPLIEIFRRSQSWQCTEARASESVKLMSIKCELSVDEVYARGVIAPAKPPGPRANRRR